MPERSIRHEEPLPATVLEGRIRALESRVNALTEAIRILVHALEGIPLTEPGEGEHEVARAARQAHDLLLLAESPPTSEQPHPGNPHPDRR